MIGNPNFFSATYRLFRIEGLESTCEDYGQAVIYRGTVPEFPDRFVLDKHHRIEAGRAFPVCGNTSCMLHDTRFADHCTFIGDFTRHFGIFPGCGAAIPFDVSGTDRNNATCC